LRARRTRLKRHYPRTRKLREGDLDGPGRDLLDGWASVAAKVEALDEHFEEVGLLDEAGNLRGPVSTLRRANVLGRSRLAAGVRQSD